MVVSDKEGRTCAASKAEQMDSITSSSKTSLFRYHEKIFNKCFSLSIDKYNLYRACLSTRAQTHPPTHTKTKSNTKSGVLETCPFVGIIKGRKYSNVRHLCRTVPDKYTFHIIRA